MMFRLFAAPLALAFAAMVSAQQPAAPPVADISTAPVSAGLWIYQAVPGGSTARFIDATGTARFALECSKATRRVTIARTSAVAAPSIFLWASDASRTLFTRFEPNAMRLATELTARDPLLDAIAFSRGRIAVTIGGAAGGAQALVMPAWPEAARTIEDCRI
jgi:hypothetical protein